MCQTTLREKDTESEVLLAALELSEKTWKVAMGACGQTRQVTIKSRDLGTLLDAFEKAKKRFGLGPEATVVSCYEAGRDGFWIHRALIEAGVNNVVVDAASIEVDRRFRRAKTDRLDAGRLLAQLGRFHGGESQALRTVVVPSREVEDARRPGRELERLRHERTMHSNRIRSLLVLEGIVLKVGTHFRKHLSAACGPDGDRLPPHLKAEVLREYERWELVRGQIRLIEAERAKELNQESPDQPVRDVIHLSNLRSIGVGSADMFVREVFWREFQNQRQVGSCVGLAPTPYASGGMNYEQGINKAGNRRARRVLIEITWAWLRFQPDSELTKWFERRFGNSARERRRGIVALARRLIIALWRYLRDGVIPEGATLKTTTAGA
jgi:transposase